MEKNKSSQVSQGLVSDYTTSAVPEKAKKSFVNNAAVWFGFTVSISAFLTGGTLGGGMAAGKGIAAVLIGNGVLILIASLLGIIGQRTGLTTASLGRIVFGKKGSIISSFVLGVLGMCLIGVLMNSFGSSIAALLPGFPAIVAILLFAVCITSSSIFGYKGLTIISYIAVPSLLVLLVIGLAATGKLAGGLGQVFDIVPAGEMTLAAGISSVIATWANGACLSADISRYSRKPSHVIGGSIFGFLVGTSVFEGCAVLMSVATGGTDFTSIFKALGLLVPGLIILLLALWTTTDNNVYSSSLAFTNLSDLVGIKIPKWGWTIICVAIAVLASTFGFAKNFGTWLGYLGAFTTPFAGILIAHFWVMNSPKANSYRMPAGFRLSAFIAWVCGFIICRIVVANQAAIPLPSSVCGMIAGFVLYIVLSKLMDKEKDSDEVFAIEQK